MKKVLFLVLGLALLATTAVAQTSTTGSIDGNVVDSNGAAVPGVTITVTSSNLIRPQSATTNDNGHYQILSLPPGRYTVTAEAAKGFAKFEQSNVEVNLSKTSTVDIQLQAAGTSAVVNVTETAGAAIDQNSNTTGTNVSSDQFSNFPTARTVQGLYTIAPTAARSGLRDASGRERDPSVGGSSGPENNYILDGVNTSDPAFGGAGANLPFEFVQEVEIKTGAYGPEYGKSTGGIFNVITKSGGNEVHGDLYGYGVTNGLVRAVNNFPFTGAAANGYSEIDAGGDIGGPIKKDKLWFFGAFNPQRRKNFYLTQTFHTPAENKVTTPFYAGKVTWAVNQKNTFTFSTFGDFTKVEGFLATGALTNASGFGSDINAFNGTTETGGHNYTFRANSTITNNFIAEFSAGLHFQRANTIPVAIDQPLIADNFAVLKSGTVLGVTQSGLDSGSTATGFLDYVDGRGGSLQRNFLRGPGFGLYGDQTRNRYEFNAHLSNILGKHTVKWGFEAFRNRYNIQTLSSGPAVTYANPLNVGTVNLPAGAVATNGVRITNNFSVCTVRGTIVVCPSATAAARLTGGSTADFPTNGTTVNTARLAGIGITAVQLNTISADEANNNPFLVRTTTRVRDFELNANTYTNVESFYVGDDYKLTKNILVSYGARWDYQQAYNTDGGTYVKLNNFKDNLSPRLGASWDFTGKGKGKVFFNFSRFLEVPLPLDLNVRSGGGDSQTDKNFNVDRLNAPSNATIATGFTPVNLGADATPIDPGLKPQSTFEFTAGGEYEVKHAITLGVRGEYRYLGWVIEDGSFDDGNTYFIFNPGRRGSGETTEDKACSDPTIGCFGHARRYYRALEFTATKRFEKNYQFVASYVYSSLTGNYEGLFRNDNGQSDPNITSLFDLVSLLKNLYGRLPNDRPHQFKFNGSYRTPWKLLISANFYAQSGSPFNQLIPHPVYGNNEGFGVPRGTAIVPTVTATQPGFPNVVDSIGSNRTPTTFNLDMGFYYPVKLGEKRELRFTGDWFNVFNNQRAVTLDQTFSINSGVTGVPPVVNPFYGAALLVQAPSAFRFGAKLTF